MAYALAGEQLWCGVDVIAECVNPLPVTCDAWRQVVGDAGSELVEVEMIRSDLDERRRRAEARTADIEGHPLPTWTDIVSREYVPWFRNRTVIDTASMSAHDAASSSSTAYGTNVIEPVPLGKPNVLNCREQRALA